MTALVSKRIQREKSPCSGLPLGKIIPEWNLMSAIFLLSASLCVFIEKGWNEKAKLGLRNVPKALNKSILSSTTVQIDREGYGLILTSVSILSHSHKTSEGLLSCIRETNDLLAVRK